MSLTLSFMYLRMPHLYKESTPLQQMLIKICLNLFLIAIRNRYVFAIDHHLPFFKYPYLLHVQYISAVYSIKSIAWQGILKAAHRTQAQYRFGLGTNVYFYIVFQTLYIQDVREIYTHQFVVALYKEVITVHVLQHDLFC